MDKLIARLRDLSDAVTEGRDALNREFTMRVPAEPDRDADLVLSSAADLLDRLQAENKRLREALQRIVDDHDFVQAHPEKWFGTGDRGAAYAETARAALEGRDE